ncbi:sensor histidine kinase [Dactylosporangium sp. AC04546]|uniref:sensor histidine kinase n=1 Tax=Dactylosporangium sp. AC04546 TaxID=2862460 RepID=UPI001EE147A0|nr:sensor histidine kinase [Dactylosporangium sp. AC04546]WVK79914.1 sensor histidine kinase [Dactylosporangium sp. AC04546]
MTQPTRRPMARFFWLWAAVWLFYMAGPVAEAWQRPQLWERVAGLAVALAFCVVYLLSFVAARSATKRTGTYLRMPEAFVRLGVMLALTVALTLIAGESGLTALVYVGVIAVFTLPPPYAWSVVGGSALTAFVLPRVVPGWDRGIDLTFAVMVAALAVWGVTRVVQRNAQLAEAREEITELAIAAERNRFARDLHDLLGHSLTVVSVKSELAGRLVRLAPERAEAELEDIQRLVREALADVRAAVSGYREMSLATELVSARSALDAAGIEAEVPLTGDAADPGRQELFAWVVREGVTNVVRHSEAKHCWITVGRDWVEVTDDGRGPTTAAGVGHGLKGLRERLDAAGCSLSVGHRDGGGFTLRAAAA